MKIAASIAATLVAGLTLHSNAHADVKNVGGLVCMHYASSEAPKSVEYVTSYGQMCNNSATERLRVSCPLTQDEGTDENVSVTFDYTMWNLNGLNGNHSNSDNSEQFFQCTVFTRTRYAQAYYWGEWKDANDVGGYGATPTALYASAAMLDDGFTHGVCFIPRIYGGQRSCVSHLKYNEQ